MGRGHVRLAEALRTLRALRVLFCIRSEEMMFELDLQEVFMSLIVCGVI